MCSSREHFCRKSEFDRERQCGGVNMVMLIALFGGATSSDGGASADQISHREPS
jgi:hypothetical protein